ncbi:MAG: hypothetical protein ACP5HJ_01025 [Candidatus Micrarchaeia archaeon]|jgi:hypothetical protein
MKEDYEINSEIRYLTIELMKLAIQNKKSFKEISQEFIKNAFYLKELIKKSE